MQAKLWLLIMCIGALLLPPYAAAPASQAAVNEPASHTDSVGQFAVQWTISANGSASSSGKYSSWTVYRNILVQGSAIVTNLPGGSTVTQPFQLTVTDTSHSVYNDKCEQRVTHEAITDPGRYNGGPDEFWMYPGDFLVLEREDGSWYMNDPFYLSFWVNGQVTRDFTYRTTRRSRHFCGPVNSPDQEYSSEDAKYVLEWGLIKRGYNVPFEGDPEGVEFRKSQSWVEDYHSVGGYPVSLQVNFDATIRRIGGCADLEGPIDAGNPAVKDLRINIAVDNEVIPPNQGDTLSPPDPATLTIRATCEGVEVKNVELKVSVDAKANSGGHHHANQANPRPRGYLRGPQHKEYVEITRKTPSITVTTDDKGEAKVQFLPGRDNPSGSSGGRCAGKQRGISGDYQVEVVPTLPKFMDKKAEKIIFVERMDFVPLVAGEHYFEKYRSTVHPEGTWGKLPTMQVIQALANDFYAAQVAHNEELAKKGKEPWPIQKLAIIDISLPDGGLFDTGGTNVCAAGQPRVGFIPWQIPHQTHLNGVGIDISTRLWIDKTGRYKWWRNTLRALGCKYGTWAKEAAFHLNADQASSGWGSFHKGCTYTKDAAVSAQNEEPSDLVMVTMPVTGPDVFVTLVSDAADEEIVRVAPGDVVTYTIGVNNLLGTTPAHGVEVAATLPAGLSFVRGEPAPTRMDGANKPVWAVGDLAAGAFPQLFDLVFQVDAGVQPGAELILTADGTSTDAEALVENNTDLDMLFGRPAGPDLAALTDLEAVAMTADAPVTVTMSVVNVGSASAVNANLSLTLPVSTTLLSAIPVSPTVAANVLTWNLGTLAPKAEAAAILHLDLSAAATAPFDPATGFGAAVAFAWQVATAGDVDATNNSGTVETALTLAGHDAQATLNGSGPPPGTLAAGDAITFTATYANLGNQITPTSTVSLQLGEGLRFVDAQPPAKAAAGQRLSWELGALAVGAEGVVVVHAQTDSVPDVGNLTVAELRSAGTDLVAANNVAFDSRAPGQEASAGKRRVFVPVISK